MGDFLSLITEAPISADGCFGPKHRRAGCAEGCPLGLLGMLMSVFKLAACIFPSACLLASLVSCKPWWEQESGVARSCSRALSPSTSSLMVACGGY